MAGKKEQRVDPWTAEAAEGESSIDYNKLIGNSLASYMRSYHIYDESMLLMHMQIHNFVYDL